MQGPAHKHLLLVESASHGRRMVHHFADPAVSGLGKLGLGVVHLLQEMHSHAKSILLQSRATSWKDFMYYVSFSTGNGRTAKGSASPSNKSNPLTSVTEGEQVKQAAQKACYVGFRS